MTHLYPRITSVLKGCSSTTAKWSLWLKELLILTPCLWPMFSNLNSYYDFFSKTPSFTLSLALIFTHCASSMICSCYTWHFTSMDHTGYWHQRFPCPALQFPLDDFHVCEELVSSPETTLPALSLYSTETIDKAMETTDIQWKRNSFL